RPAVHDRGRDGPHRPARRALPERDQPRDRRHGVLPRCAARPRLGLRPDRPRAAHALLSRVRAERRPRRRTMAPGRGLDAGPPERADPAPARLLRAPVRVAAAGHVGGRPALTLPLAPERASAVARYAVAALALLLASLARLALAGLLGAAAPFALLVP